MELHNYSGCPGAVEAPFRPGARDFRQGTGTDDPKPEPNEDGGSTSQPEACTLAGGDKRGFGATCETDDDCTCEANYCAVQFGQSVGYCTVTTCDTKPSVCPKDWSCMDLSVFFPTLPYICQKP